jgi:hypothetical protein
MEANPQVMRQPETVIRPFTHEQQVARPAAAAESSPLMRNASWGHSPERLSIDPMRTTDRYRLVMPWSNRV